MAEEKCPACGQRIMTNSFMPVAENEVAKLREELSETIGLLHAAEQEGFLRERKQRKRNGELNFENATLRGLLDTVCTTPIEEIMAADNYGQDRLGKARERKARAELAKEAEGD